MQSERQAGVRSLFQLNQTGKKTAKIIKRQPSAASKSDAAIMVFETRVVVFRLLFFFFGGTAWI